LRDVAPHLISQPGQRPRGEGSGGHATQLAMPRRVSEGKLLASGVERGVRLHLRRREPELVQVQSARRGEDLRSAGCFPDVLVFGQNEQIKRFVIVDRALGMQSLVAFASAFEVEIRIFETYALFGQSHYSPTNSRIPRSRSRVCRRLSVENDGLRLQVRQQPLAAALAPDARLLEAAEREGMRVAVRVVPDRARPYLAGERPGAIFVVGEHRRVR